MSRDREIYRILRRSELSSRNRHRLFKTGIEPLSVFAGKPGHPRDKDLTLFPVREQPNGQPMPRWEDLTPWLKTQLLVMAMAEYGLQTFTIIVARDLEDEWVRLGKDPRVELRNRMRKHIGRVLNRKAEYFFVVEAWSKRDKAPTRLHIHGGVFFADDSERRRLIDAIAKAGGQRLHGKRQEPRSVHEKVFWRDGPTYVNYLFKSVRRPDVRLERQRLSMSREATGGAREFWKMLTEPR